MTAPIRASACPSLWRIVPALDGGICRVKLPCGRLSAMQALIIADIAERCGSGILEITNRANLQLRGIRAESSNELIEALLAADLGPLTAEGDDVRNVMLNPTFGIDAQQIVDTQPFAVRILELLQTQPRFHQLSPKFSISIDGGECAAMLEHPHDLWLSAIAADKPLFAFGLAGCPQDRNSALALVPAAYVLELIEAALNLFLDSARPEQTRMRHLLQDFSRTQLRQQLRQRLSFSLLDIDGEWQRISTSSYAHVGVHAQCQTDLCYVGAVPLLGRLNVTQLRLLAQLAQTFGDSTLRMTPFQSVLLPNIPQFDTARLLQQLNAMDTAIHPKDSRAHVIACSGASGCVKSRADTKADAQKLMQISNERLKQTQVHFTGCERSCAAAHVAPFTLLAVADGHYDIYRRNHGDAKFGELIASNYTVEQCAERLISLQETIHD